MTFLSKMIGEEVFLQGTYLNVAINSSGSIGSRSTAPTGFLTDIDNGFIRLGLMGDMDGFGKGTKGATRDAMLQGSSLEGFSLGYDIGSKHYVKANSERNSIVQIAGGDGTNLSDAATGKAAWVGTTSENVKVDQVVTLSGDDKYMKFEVTLTNNSGSTLSDLRYMRSIDPDHGVDFKTINTIVEQGGDGANGALIAAYMANGTNPLFYYTQDERARVSTYGLDNRDPYKAASWNEAAAEGTSVKADQAININFALGKLAAGASTTVTFYLGITDDLPATVKKIDASAGADPVPTPTPPVVVEPVNSAPTAAADSLAAKSGGTATSNVLANDRDGDGDALTAQLIHGPANGTLRLAADGSCTYVAKAGFSGTDSFTYAASDGKASSSATVTVVVEPLPNTAPTIVADALTVKAGGTGTGNVLTNDKDADGDALVAKLLNGPANGTVKLAEDGSFTYTPKAGFSGTDSFTYSGSDGKASSSAMVTLTVTPPPNSAPTAVADSAATTGTDKVTGNVLANDFDSDGDALTVALKSGPKNGEVSLADDGSYSYVAKEGFSGADSFTYTLSDGKTTSSADVTLTVGAAPVVVPPPPPPVVLPPVVVRPVVEPPVVKPPVTSPAESADDHSVLSWGNVQTGSGSENQTLTATAGKDIFFFDIDSKSGSDTVVGFGKNDLIATSKALYDGNGDGVITWSKRLTLDGSDTVGLAGVKSLRFMGTDADGTFIYANGSVRPKNALEGIMGDNVLTGDLKDKKSQTFFFDTNQSFDLGSDQVQNFGVKDRIVTTAKLDADSAGHVNLGLTGQFALTAGDDIMGHVAVTNLAGEAVHTLEFDGSVIQNGTTYYVYSTDGSSVGVAGLNF